MLFAATSHMPYRSSSRTHAHTHTPPPAARYLCWRHAGSCVCVRACSRALQPGASARESKDELRRIKKRGERGGSVCSRSPNAAQQGREAKVGTRRAGALLRGTRTSAVRVSSPCI